MNLSGLIFVALAVAWAGYLLPRALRRTDDHAVGAPDIATDHARVLTRTPQMMRALLAPTEPVTPEQRSADKAALKASEAQRRSAFPKTAPAGPAVRRRRILLVLTLATAGVAGAAGLGYLPWWSVAVPAVLVVAWLVTCARTAKAERRRAVRPRRSVVEPVEAAEPVSEPEVEPVAAAADSSSDDGALWDPLPLTLPTYLGKPVARRTARAIELTAVTSSGRSASDSALARSVRAGAAAAAPVVEEPVEHRRAAGA